MKARAGFAQWWAASAIPCETDFPELLWGNASTLFPRNWWVSPIEGRPRAPWGQLCLFSSSITPNLPFLHISFVRGRPAVLRVKAFFLEGIWGIWGTRGRKAGETTGLFIAFLYFCFQWSYKCHFPPNVAGDWGTPATEKVHVVLAVSFFLCCAPYLFLKKASKGTMGRRAHPFPTTKPGEKASFAVVDFGLKI